MEYINNSKNNIYFYFISIIFIYIHFFYWNHQNTLQTTRNSFHINILLLSIIPAQRKLMIFMIGLVIR